jgi:hypothetical protein
VLQEYIAHYNTHRPHRSLEQHLPAYPPGGYAPRLTPRWSGRYGDGLGGLLREYVGSK